MPGRHVVVDGSNIATEGRTLPSLAQLDQAVREYLLENPEDSVTVVVDASFAHRIDPSEQKMFEEAEEANELVSPPAGAIGRGDAFLLRIADKTGATVLSNDSFQEFHGEYEWLFNNGRLIGGKPVPGVGWIFTPRTPVRGPKSREAVKEAKRRRSTGETLDGTGLDMARRRPVGARQGRKVAAAIATATEEATDADTATRRRRRSRGTTPPAEPVNEPLSFITFIAEHPLGAEVTGTVESFSSHGAFIDAAGARCYIPLSAMGDPPPRKSRDVLAKGEERTFIVQALDPLRRGVELALPGFAKIAGAPTDETVEAEITPVAEPSSRRRRRPAAPAPGAEEVAVAAGSTPSRARKAAKAAQPVEADEVAAEPVTPAPARRSRKKAAAAVEAPVTAPAVEEAPPEVAAAPAPARRSRKKAAAAVEPIVEADAEPAPAPAKRARKASKASKASKVAEPVAPAPAVAEPAPAKRARKASKASKVAEPVAPAQAVAEPAPARAKRARKAAKAVEAPAPEPAAEPTPAPARRTRKAVAKAAEPAPAEAPPAEAAAAPAKRARKAAKAAAPAANDPNDEPAAETSPEPTIAGRRSPRRAAAAAKGSRASTGRA